ncbi:MAG: hypothetical protein ACK5M7_10350 [Draconibacterium sp.]
MFRFPKTSSARLIDQAFREMVGPDFVNEFWEKFKDNYVTCEGNGPKALILIL